MKESSNETAVNHNIEISVELLKHSEMMAKNVNSNIDSFIIYQELLFTIKKSIFVLLLLSQEWLFLVIMIPIYLLIQL